MDEFAGRHRQPFAWGPVGLVTVGLIGLLVALAGHYDYHCDELYFRTLADHLSWGYPDQPPLTPLLAKVGIWVFGDTVWGIRVLPGVITGLVAPILALIAREAGGATRAQVLAGLGILSVFPLVSGHALVTTTADLAVWTLVGLCVLRALLRREPRYWLAVGVVTGLGLYNKHLVILLLVALALGLLLVGPRDSLRSGWLLAGAGLAVAIGLPNLIYQVVNDFPQLEMARALADADGTQGNPRGRFVPMQLAMLGPLAVPIWTAGILTLLRRPDLRRARAVAVAYGVLCGLLLVLAGQAYYTPGLLLSLYAVGCVAVVRWLTTPRDQREPRPAGLARRIRPARPVRVALVYSLIAVNATSAALLAFPPVPQRTAATSAFAKLNIVLVNQFGWAAYAEQVARVYQGLPPADRSAATVITANSWLVGALDRYGAGSDLPPAHSGHNGLYQVGRPPPAAAVAILVGEFEPAALPDTVFERCELRGRLDNLAGLDNEDHGSPIRVCWQPTDSWASLWPRFRRVG